MLNDYIEEFLLYKNPGLDCPGTFLGALAWGRTAERAADSAGAGFHGREQRIAVRSEYTLYVPMEQGGKLRPAYGDYIQRLDGDGGCFRVISGDGRRTPKSANRELCAYTVIEAGLPEVA